MFCSLTSLTTGLVLPDLVSKIIGLIPFFLNSIAVSYALSLLVNIIGFFPINTPYNLIYSFAADAKITPGVSLFPNTKGLSIAPVEITTSFALIYQSFCLGVYGLTCSK